ncbi:hypothetical protein [Streptomyces mirabilis]
MVDVSGPAGVARVGKGSGGGWVWTCAYGTLDNDGESMPPFTLHGVDGTEPGDSGTVTYTASADNTASVTGTTGMTAQSGLVLTARPRNCSCNPTFTDARCTVPAKAAPRTAYRTSSPFTFTAVPGELTGTLDYSWSSDPRRTAKLTVRGPGPGRPAEERGRFEVVPPEGTTVTSRPRPVVLIPAVPAAGGGERRVTSGHVTGGRATSSQGV